MSEVKFSKEHEWITLEGDVATIGITKHATEMLGNRNAWRHSFCRTS